MPTLLPRILCVFAALLTNLANAAEPPRVDADRLHATMETMKGFGATPEGGSMRVAYSEANREALAYIDALMTSAGLATRIDAAGNLIGTRPGTRPGLRPLMTGSHIDTVPNGGHYDGVVGAMGALEVARTLHDLNVQTRHPIEFIIWSNEEGGKNGSRAMGGLVQPAELALPSLGERSLGEGMRFLGGNPDALETVARGPGEAAAYFELHIEQGAILDRRAIDIGVVQGIVGIRRWNISVEGMANHAGTTPMDQRQDALYAAARLVTLIRDEITRVPGSQVGTVGRIQAYPGAPNVIPGRATLSLEIRDLSMDRIGELFTSIRAAAARLAEETATTIRFDQFYESLAAPTDPRLQAMVADSAHALGLSTLAMPSGAGHDAQSLATICPIGMIFVPSEAGISHAPQEYTAPVDIAKGADVLLRALLRADAELD
jgi:N-carbamoyl-L-amino-acid hydrolase